MEQRGLADPGLTQDRHDLGGAGRSGIVGRKHPTELLIAAIAGVARHNRRLVGRPPGKGGILVQDPVVKNLQLGAGVHAQLVTEGAPQPQDMFCNALAADRGACSPHSASAS
jgi:hypothetical protein